VALAAAVWLWLRPLIIQLPLDVRKAACSRVVLSGIGALIKGIKSRYEDEVAKIVSANCVQIDLAFIDVLISPPHLIGWNAGKND
jgi:actin-related protein